MSENVLFFCTRKKDEIIFNVKVNTKLKLQM